MTDGGRLLRIRRRSALITRRRPDQFPATSLTGTPSAAPSQAAMAMLKWSNPATGTSSHITIASTDALQTRSFSLRELRAVKPGDYGYYLAGLRRHFLRSWMTQKRRGCGARSMNWPAWRASWTARREGGIPQLNPKKKLESHPPHVLKIN